MLGERLMPQLVKLLDGPAVSYGKGAIVGVASEMEHGGACVHPTLGKPMRAAIGGGKAVIGSNVKVAAAADHHDAQRVINRMPVILSPETLPEWPEEEPAEETAAQEAVFRLSRLLLTSANERGA
jgi:hypothetical protein